MPGEDLSLCPCEATESVKVDAQLDEERRERGICSEPLNMGGGSDSEHVSHYDTAAR